MALSRKLQKRPKVRFKSPKKEKKRSAFLLLFSVLLVLGGWYLLENQKEFKKDVETASENIVETVTGTKKAPPTTVAETQAKIDAILLSEKGTYGYSIIDLATGETFGKNQTMSFVGASTVKVAFATYALKKVDDGTLKLTNKWTYTSADYEGGTGNIIGYEFGTKFSMETVLKRMIEVSDNAGANMTLRYTGRTNIQKYLDTNGITGFKLTENLVTPDAMSKLLQYLYDGKLIKQSSLDLLIGFMKNSILKNRVVGGVPEGVPVAHKIGTQSGAISDVAIVYHPEHPYVISVYSKGVTGEAAAAPVISKISGVIYEHFDSK